jgi:glycosyltransferase involved in cell wall biosynthesis
MNSPAQLGGKKVVFLLGSQRPAPPTPASNTICWLLAQYVEHLPRLDLKVISLWDDSLAGIPYDPRRYLHVRPAAASYRMAQWLLEHTPYRLRTRWFGIAHPQVLAYYLEQARLLRRLRPEIAVTHVSWPLFRIAKRALPSAKHIFYFHSSNLGDWPQADVGELFRSAAGVVAVCEVALQSLAARYGALPVPARAIHNGVDLRLFNPARREGLRQAVREKFGFGEADVVALYAGRLARSKGVDVILNAFLHARRSCPNLKLCIVGDENIERAPDQAFAREFRQRVEDFKETGLYEEIKFLGWLFYEDMIQAYALADISLLASREIEGNPMFLLESMACGLPVISSAVGGVPEIVQDGQTGLLVSAQELETQFGQALGRLAADPFLRASMGQQGADLIRDHFSVQIMANQFEAFLREI